MRPEEFIKQIEEKLFSVSLKPEFINQGTVETVADGIIKATGLSGAGFGEEVAFDNGTRGLILNLDEDFVSIIMLSESEDIHRGMKVRTTGRVLGVMASDQLIGRVIDPLQNPLDGKELKPSGTLYPLEKIAPGIIERRSVDRPVKTGITAIDAMTPIGRGQRELIIGDRNTGKTAIAIDAIINQKKCDLGLKRVICIYCAIGQKRSNIARIVAKLEEEGALAYTIVVAGSASDPVAMQYIAPFAACAIGEYFMDKGEDVLVVYDDLTKHAWAYRQMSLLIRRPAGREAYPGDIFYLHSRLLERASRLSDERGGGTLTALPIIETQANDVSAYIPTNVISITDGQIYLESDLFNAGVRPAINVGLSVSRVGGAAQSKSMKQIAGPLRLELAQFRELQAFTQFGSDLDEATTKKIERGKRLLELLKQPQYQPLNEVAQVISIFAATYGLLDDIPVEKVRDFEEKLIEFISLQKKDIVERLHSGAKMDDAAIASLKQVISEFKKGY
ncbi:MAG: F0F1 ATP synthase subunit alpha [Endomicrobiales bacterium]|jgi:F-type H+-transporting ATPase subunit alpha